MTTTRIQDLQERASQAGMQVAPYSPGDGITRYRFFAANDPSTYFGPSSGLYTALGISDAETFVAAVLVGRALMLDEERKLNGTEGQDRKSYTDDQDRQSYVPSDGSADSFLNAWDR